MKLLGNKGVSDPAGDKAPYLAIAYLKFNSADELQKALVKHGTEILGDIPNYTKIDASERGHGELSPDIVLGPKFAALAWAARAVLPTRFVHRRP
jgi:hypothetical protein